MNRLMLTASIPAFVLALAAPALAEGELNIFNWGNYTSPEAIKKFETENDIKVTITDYDSNDTALAKVAAGGHGFDIVVPSANYVSVYADRDLIAELDHAKLKNFGNIEPQFADVDWDPGRKWSIPYLWGSTGVVVNRDVYKGDINTSAIIFNPPPELEGKVNILPEMGDVVGMALMYVGSEFCTEDKEALKKARDLLMAAKPKWIAMDYGAIEKMTNNDYAASLEWNGAALRIRADNPDVEYGYPREGYPVFMDSLALLKDAKNIENAYKFMDFALEPENAAMFSDFSKYANAVTGSAEFLPEDMKNAPEVQTPEEFKKAGVFYPRCEGQAREYMTAIWTEVQK